MAIACVTGASRGIGRAVTLALVERGWTVCAVARTFDDRFESDKVIAINADLANAAELRRACTQILNVGEVALLINNAGVGRFGPHETLTDEDLEGMLKLNLLAPMMMCKMLLRSIRRECGCIVNVASTSGLEARRFGCAYAATKAGLIHFGHSLFEETRKQGVRVVNVSPDFVRTDFYDDADFAPSEQVDCSLTIADVVNAITYAIDQPRNAVVNDVVIRPQKVGIQKK